MSDRTTRGHGKLRSRKRRAPQRPGLQLETLESRWLLDSQGPVTASSYTETGPWLSDFVGPLQLGPEAAAVECAGSDRPFVVNLASGPNRMTLRRAGPDVQLVDDVSGAEIARQVYATTRSIEIWGADEVDDTLTIDFGGGELERPMAFHGGASGFDTLVLEE